MPKVKIKDIDIYLKRMKNGLDEKMFFLSHIEIKKPILFIDYGCADATVIKEVLKIYKDNVIAIGIDNNPNMLEIAKNNCEEFQDDNYHFFSSCDKANKWIKENIHNDITKIINLSSVLHEIYSYLSQEEIDQFWNDIYKLDPDYISIRDMCFEPIDNRTELFKMKDNIVKYSMQGEICKYFLDYFFKRPMTEENCVQFLLKYKYIENWDRESKENYFSFSHEELVKRIPEIYKTTYERKYTLPYMKKCIQNDFKIDLKSKTHIQILFKKTEDKR